MGNNTDTGSSNNGLRGKFRERLRLIRINRYKKRVKDKEDNDKFIRDKISEIKRSINNDDKVVVRVRPISKGINNRVKVVKKNKFSDVSVDNKISNRDTDRKVFVDRVIRRVRETSSDRDYGKRYGINDKKKKISNNISSNDKDLVKDELRVKIIKRIRRDFDKKLAELDVLESELYFLDKDNDVAVDLDRVKEIRKKINDIIGKINNIIEQYNIYNNSYELENVIDIDDDSLVNDIINFKGLVNSYDRSRLASDYKLLDEYRDLYSKLDYISGIVDNINIKNEDKISSISDRDSKYKNINKDMGYVSDSISKCDMEIKRQNDYLAKVMAKVGDIDSREYTKYKVRGINELISQSFKYLGLLMISPFKGLVPSIMVDTLITRKMIKNIYDNMYIDKINRVEYMAYDYEREINSRLWDIDYTFGVIDDTINMVDRLKSDFGYIYDSRVKGYDDTLRKLDSISDRVLNNRYRMELVKNKLMASKRINDDKLKKVKVLNESSK